MMPSDLAKISTPAQQPVVRQTDVKASSVVDVTRVESTQVAATVARVNKTQQGQESAAKSGQILPHQGQNTASQDKESVQAAVSNIEDYVQSVNRDLKFSVDTETQEVIRQIPSEEALSMARKLQDNLGDESGGLLFQDNA